VAHRQHRHAIRFWPAFEHEHAGSASIRVCSCVACAIAERRAGRSSAGSACSSACVGSPAA
jgi:NADH:ubiquinone oxidoreductase subunit E